MYGYFKQQTNEIAHNQIWTWVRKGDKRDSESLLIAAQNTDIMTNYIKAKIDDMQQNNKY